MGRSSRVFTKISVSPLEEKDKDKEYEDKPEIISPIIREFLNEYYTKQFVKKDIIRLNNCTLLKRTKKSKIKNTTVTSVLFLNFTRFPISVSIRCIKTSINKTC